MMNYEWIKGSDNQLELIVLDLVKTTFHFFI